MPFPSLSDDQLLRLDVAAPRYTSYPTVPVWSEGFGSEDYARALEAAATSRDPLSVYVHIPFCHEMCSFCGCNAIVSRSVERADRYLAAVEREIDLVADRLGSARPISRVHLGGGTPTSLNLRQLVELWEAITYRFAIAHDAELAIEIDPAITTEAQLSLLAGLGFNRISMGVQDFDPDVQRAVNRIQSIDETRALVDHARTVGFQSVSLDLICGLPKQTPQGWAKTLDEVIAMGPDRLAVFSFAYVPDAKPHQRRLARFGIPGGAEKLGLQRIAYERLVTAGYEPIGFDHFARPDDELAAAARDGRLWRDFQGYTTLRAPDTIAFGITGIGSVGGAYVQNVRPLRDYDASVAAGRLPVARGLWLDADDRRRRDLITEIMCRDEIDVPADLAGDLPRLDGCVRDGLVEVDGAHVHLTDVGRLFRRNVAMCFDTHLRRQAAAPTFSRTI